MGYSQRELLVFCPACGGPFNRFDHTPTGEPGMPQWQLDVTLLRVEATGEFCIQDEPLTEDVEILEHLVCTGGAFFKDPQNPDVLEYNSYNTYGARDKLEMYSSDWPLHSKCLEIARRVARYNCNSTIAHSSEVGFKSLREMIEMFRVRLEDALDVYGSVECMNYITEPNCYYGYGEHHSACLDRDLGPKKHKLVEQPPFPLPNLTSFILSKLKRFRFKQNTSLRQTQKKLPQEIIDQMLEIQPVGILSLQCSRTLLPSVWRNALFQTRLTPWLWDLERADVPEQYWTEGCPEIETSGDEITEYEDWDWELLVRELTQPEPFRDEPDGDEPTCHGLCNRRRAWLVLEGLRFGDLYDPTANANCNFPREPTRWEVKHYPHLWPKEAREQGYGMTITP